MTTIQIGIIGAGNRGIQCFGEILKARSDARVASLSDPNPERLKAARAILGDEGIALHTDNAALLADERLDAVVVTVPDRDHREVITAALRAGKHVLADKPLATTTADCMAIGRVARETGRIVDMGFNLRHHAVCMKIKALIDEGAIGRLIAIDERAYYWGGRTYMSRWNRLYEMSGGLFVHKGSHDFDLMNWFNPDGLPAAVSAFAGVEALRGDRLPFEVAEGETVGPTCKACGVAHKCRDRFEQEGAAETLFDGAAREAEAYDRDLCLFLSEKDTHDNGVAIVEYTNGVRCSYWEVFFTPVSTRRFTIIGDRGHLDADLTERTLTLYPRWTKDRVDYTIAPAEGLHGGADPVMVDTFLRNLREGRAPVATLYDGTLAVSVGEAAETARREGRVVRIEELIGYGELRELVPEG